MTWPSFAVHGPDIAAPLGWPAPSEPDRIQRAVAWAAAIDQAIRDNDAWGILLTSPDGDLRLYGVEPRTSLADWLVSYNARGCRLIRANPGWDSPPRTDPDHAWVRTMASDGRFCALCHQPEATWTGSPCPGANP